MCKTSKAANLFWLSKFLGGLSDFLKGFQILEQAGKLVAVKNLHYRAVRPDLTIRLVEPQSHTTFGYLHTCTCTAVCRLLYCNYRPDVNVDAAKFIPLCYECILGFGIESLHLRLPRHFTGLGNCRNLIATRANETWRRYANFIGW
jgi:hypothetical protein